MWMNSSRWSLSSPAVSTRHSGRPRPAQVDEVGGGTGGPDVITVRAGLRLLRSQRMMMAMMMRLGRLLKLMIVVIRRYECGI